MTWVIVLLSLQLLALVQALRYLRQVCVNQVRAEQNASLRHSELRSRAVDQ